MLFAWGAANVAAGFTGSLLTGNSPSRSAAMDASGSKSQLPSLVAAGTIAVVMLFFTDLLAYLPNAALAGIVANAVLSLIEVHELRELWRMRRSEFWIAAVCLLSVLALGPLRAVLIAFLLSTIDVIRRASSPDTAVLEEAPDGSHFFPVRPTAGIRESGPRRLPVRRPALLRQRAPCSSRRSSRSCRRARRPRPVVRPGRRGDGRRRHDRLGGPEAGDRAADRTRASPSPSAAPTPSFRSWLEKYELAEADRPEPLLPDKPTRRRGVPPGEEDTMKAITVEPLKPGSARLEEVPEPDIREGSVLVEAIAVGVCGTDVEIAEGKYGWAPPGHDRLILGHESLGRVIDPGLARGLKKGDLVVGIVRRPDGVPCPACAVGEWDMCRNGQYTERGIKEIHGYMSERWRIEPEYAIKVDPSLGLLGVLLEPMTVISKALEQVVFIGQRSFWEPKTVLVTGAGPIGLLAACGAKPVREGGPRPRPRRDRPEAGPRPRPRCDLPLRERPRRPHRAGRHHRVHGRRIGHRRLVPEDRLGRNRLPDGRRRGRALRLRRGRHRGEGRPEEQRHRRQRQREQAPLVQGVAGPRPGRPGVAEPPDHAPREAGGLPEALDRKPDDIKVVIQFSEI